MPIGNAFSILKSIKVKVPMVELYATGLTPSGITSDSNNNLFVANNSYIIYKVDTNKTTTQFIDLRVIPTDNESGPSVDFLDTDSSDNIYTTDSVFITPPNKTQYHFNIKKITPSGTVTDHITGAGSTTGICVNGSRIFFGVKGTSGTTNSSVSLKTENIPNITSYIGKIKLPRGIAMDSKGDLYVADSGTHVIYKYVPNSFGNKIVYAGRANQSGYLNSNTLTDSLFNQPMGICFDKYDNLYVADLSNHSIRKITPNGVISTLIGNTQGNTTGYFKDVKISAPSDVHIAKDEAMYIADTGNSCIKKLVFEA
jgi:sugar lactone lactonase YvrE